MKRLFSLLGLSLTVAAGGPIFAQAITSGNNQTAQINANFGAPVIVSGTGCGTTNLVIPASVPSGAITFSNAVCDPANGGTYSFSMTAGSKPGNFGITFTGSSIGTNLTVFTVGGTAMVLGVSKVTLTATASSATVNTAVAANNFSATVTDIQGNGLPNIPVTWSTDVGNCNGNNHSCGTFTPTQSVTDVTGVALSPPFQLNTIADSTFNVVASATDGTLTAITKIPFTNLAGPQLINPCLQSNNCLGANNPQDFSVKIKSGVPDLQFTVADSFGNVVKNQTITCTSATVSGGATLTVNGTAQNVNLGGTNIFVNNSGNPQRNAACTGVQTGAKSGTATLTATITGSATATSDTITVTPAAASTMTLVPANSSASVGAAFGTLSATVFDSQMNVVPGVTVTFAVTAGVGGSSGSFAGTAPFTATTNSQGIATSPILTANGSPGTFTVSASTSGVATQMVTLTNVSGVPSTVVLTSGQTSAPLNGSFGMLTATVKDSFGNSLAGQAVAFSVPNTAGKAGATFAGGLTTDNEVTNSSGIATSASILSANTVAGTFTATATAPFSGGSAMGTLTLTNTAGGPALVSVTNGSNQATPLGKAFITPLQVLVTDQFGNPAAGGGVVFTVVPNAGSGGTFVGNVGTATVTSGANGLVQAPTLTANSTVGAFTVTAALTGTLSVATFNLSITAGSPANISVTTNTNQSQSTTVNTAFGAALSATVTDAAGNPVPFVTVTFSAPVSGASVKFNNSATSTVQTNSSGVALSTTPMNANSIAGSYSVTAAVSGVSTTAVYSLSNLPGAPANISLTTGAGLSAPINSPFGAITATVVDASGNLVPGVSVNFAVADPAGSKATATFANSPTLPVATSANGVATAPVLTAGSIAGTLSLTASVANTALSATTPANTPLTITTGPAASVAITAGNMQGIGVGKTYPVNLAVLVTDAGNNPVSGVGVTFTTTTSTGNADATFANPPAMPILTNTQGVATAPALTAGTNIGTFNVTATVANTTPALTATFAESVTSGTPANVKITQGNGTTANPGQSAIVNMAFPLSLQVQVVDGSGNPVNNVPVTFAAPPTGASAIFANKTNTITVNTDTTGTATAPVTAGATKGTYMVTVAVGGVNNTPSFSLTNTPGPPAAIIISSGNNQTVQVGGTYKALSVIVQDSSTNAVADGTQVTFTAPCVAGTAGITTFTGKTCVDTETTTNGVATSATLVANNTPGVFQVAVSAGGNTSASFTLGNTAGAAANIAYVSGNNQAATVTTGTFQPLVVKITDSAGNPVSGTAVTFTAPTSGASAIFTGNPMVSTNSQGIATSPTSTANGTAGSYQVTATIAAGSVAFNLTNLSTLTIISITPSSATEASSADVNVSIAGNGFVATDVVRFTRGQSVQNLTNVSVGSLNSLSATIPAAYLAIPANTPPLKTAESDSITVVHPDGSTSAPFTFTLNPPPTATSITPTTANIGDPNFTLTINGYSFDSAATVLVSTGANSVTLSPVKSTITSTTLNVVIPPAVLTSFSPTVAGSITSELLNVTVVDNGTTSTLTGALTLAFPNITNLSPSSVASPGPTSGSFNLQVNGTSFLAGSVVHWCATGAGCIPTKSDVTLATTLVTPASGAPYLQAVVPTTLISSPGSAIITVANEVGFDTATSSNQITFNFGALTISSVTPSTLQAVSSTQTTASTTLVISGLNFQPDATAHWVNGTQDATLVTTVASTTQVLAVVPSSLITNPASISIYVKNVANGNSSNTLPFNVVQSAITTLSQSSAAAGTPGLTLIINGTNFASGLTVQWTVGATSTQLSASQVSATQVTVAIPAALLATAGAAQIAVMNAGAIASNSVAFTINNPSITPPLVPASAALNAATFQLTVTGDNFLNGSVVQWNDGTKTTALSTTFTDASHLTALVTPSLLTTTSTVVVTVLNPGTGSPAPLSNAVPFAVGPAPTISPVSAGGLAPATAPAGSPQFTMTVTGTNFTSASVVIWDPGLPGSPTKLVTYLSDTVHFTTLTATVPASLLTAQGTATITVQNAGPVTSNPVQFTVTAGVSPTISNLTPNSASAGTATALQVSITGSSFQSGATVQWNGAGAMQTLTPVFVSSGQLNITVPTTLLGVAGTASVTVTNPGGGVSNTATFTINPANQVSINNLSITSAAAGSGMLLDTISGQFFVPTSVVLWNNGSGAVPINSQYVNSTTITAVIPASDLATPGIAFVSVQNPDKTVSNTELFTISGAVPNITALNPNSAPAGSPGFTLTITGTGFSANSTTVLWGAMQLPTLVSSTTQLSVTLTSNLLATAGTINVSVQSAGGTSNALPFTIGGPTILVLAPNSSTVGATGLTLSVGGQNFISGATVLWGTTALTTTFVSATQLTAAVPAALLAAAGAINVTVQNPGGATSAPSPFNVGTGPAVSGFTPTTVTAGSGAFTLTVAGTNFAAGDQILWSGIPLTTTFASATQLTGAVPANLTNNADTINIEVLHAGGVLSNLMTFILAGPTVTSVAPSSAPAGASSVQITVTGTNFIQTSTVQWNATAVPTAFVNATTLTAQIASTLLQNPGTAFLTVSNGTSTSGPTTFQVVGPTLSSVSPGTAVAGSGTLALTITGTNFAAGSVVNWNGTAVPTTFTNATQLMAMVPVNLASTAGTSIVTVTNPGGSGSGIAVVTLTAPPPASITSFTPSSAIAGSSAFILSVTGTSFNASSTVVWNGNNLPTTFVSATQITAFVNSTLLLQAAQVNVIVQNSGSTGAMPAVFSINGPTIVSLSPSTASAGGPAFNLSVTGTNFLPGSLIQWNSVSLPTSYNSATALTASVPASLVAAGGTASVTVQNPGGATSAASIFTIGPFTLSFTTVSLPDAIVGQIYAAPALQATGGTSPYTWSITGGVIPQGLTLDPNSGTITGTATVPGIASLTITVTDSVGRAASKTLTLHVVLALTITNTTPLTPATISSAYSLLLLASGGTPPYTWSVGGSLPAGLLLNGTSGQISGTPLVPGLSQFTITATDSRSLSITSPFSLTTALQSVTIGGITTALQPAQQPTVTLNLGGPYTVNLSGFLNLSFASAVGADDQSIQFSTGGRQAAFTLPAGSTQPLYGGSSTIAISTGTVAGSITVNAAIQAGSATVTPTPVPSQTGAIAKAVPVLTAASLTRVTGGINVSITGYSTTRDMTSATITFNPATGSTITSAPITVQLSSAFTTWYSSAASTAVGSTFTITLPFTVTGNTAAIGSATVIMTNSQGASQAITAM